MNLTTVRSKAIHAIGYDPELLLLEIVFSSGGIYRYAHVPPQIYRKFLLAPSKGGFFQKHVRGQYVAYRISRRKGAKNPPRTVEQNPAQRAL